MTPARPVDLARLALGGWALARPDDLLHLVGDGGPGPRTITRLLGGRYVVQSGAGVALPRRPPHWLDAAFDLAHAASMLGAARAVPRHRRSALASAVLAVTFAVADLREQGRVR